MRESRGLPQPASLRLALTCELGNVRGVAQTVRAFLAEQGCAEDHLIACELALVEACNNAIEHARGSQTQQPIRIEAACDHLEITLRITDHTRGFQWPERAAFPDPESEKGRGIPLIQSLMDEAAYLRSPGGNNLVLRKKR